MSNPATLIIARGREKSLLRMHPWIFSGAVGRLDGEAPAGATVVVRAFDGRFLGRGAWSPASQIRARLWSFVEDEEIDAPFFRRRLTAAVALRRDLGLMGEGEACRLVNGESDYLPGVIIDRYGAVVVCQFLAAGAEAARETIVDALEELLRPATIWERSDAEVRKKEGLRPRTGLVRGRDLPELVEIREHGHRFLVDVRQGHKTGWYLDQRDNRRVVAAMTNGKSLLNCFSYTGGFAVGALAGGAEKVVNVDASEAALALAERNAALNGLAGPRLLNHRADVFQLLREFRDQGRKFDRIVLDPPKFAEAKQQLAGAARGYKDINRLAFELLAPGGILFTFSCSGLMEPALFQKIVADAALDGRRAARIIGQLGQAADHPVALPFPEGAYLKGLICRAE
ncbi:MAG: class I SAM-dependent methyltransferase [Thermodesulfobacteriota bacterium]